MPRLTEKQVLTREAKRDLNAELLAAASELAKGRIGRALVPNGNGGFAEAEIVKARFASGLSQAQFAGLLGISKRTLQQWEQGRRSPTGAARTLLRIVAKHPRLLKESASAR